MFQVHSRISLFTAVAGSVAFFGATPAGAQFHPKLSASEAAVVDELVEGILLRQQQNNQEAPAPAPDIDTLLPSWRQPDVFTGAACMNCHSPDGFDLAMMGYTDENILRRAIPHVGEEHAVNILALVHTIRDEYDMTTLIDPMEDRPLQPGGILLPGDTGPLRDQAFGNMIAGKLRVKPQATSGHKRRPVASGPDEYALILMRATVNSLTRAKQARDQLLSVNLHTLPIGIPMNRWTEDGFHGPEHALLADWMPDLPQVVGPSEAAGWMAAQDAYVNDPSDANFWNIYWNLSDNTINNYFSGNADHLVEFKYRSMMMAQHIIRQRMLGNETLDSGQLPVFYDQLGNLYEGKLPNPMWDLGAFAKFHTNNCPEFDDCLGLPWFVTDRLNQTTMTMADHFIAIRLPWLWLGWTMDPAMQRGQHYPAAVRLLDLNRLAWVDGGGYPIHNTFAIARKLVTQSFVPESWNPTIDPRPQHLVVDFAGFTYQDQYLNAEPDEIQHRNLYRKFTANMFMMFLYLMQDEMNQNGVVYDRVDWNRSLDEMELFFEHIGDSSSSLHMVMLNQVRDQIASLPDA